ncbi:excisionase family DNA-binding protein [Mycobacterium sherrisii]|uniref:excisionase family DNA-binding protein n=1 Tax=Mycobacterium sherrisii TaxID=243061 RepID=UPI003975BA73
MSSSTAPTVGAQRQSRRRWATVAQTATYLAVTPRTVRQMVADGRLTAYRNGPRLVRIDLQEVDARMRPFGGAE